MANEVSKNEKQAHRYDEPEPGATVVKQVDEDDTGWVGARTFASEGLCVFLVAPDGVIVMTPSQARDAAMALVTAAWRVEHARMIIAGKAGEVDELQAALEIAPCRCTNLVKCNRCLMLGVGSVGETP